MGKIILMGLVAAGVVLGAGCGKKEESATEAAATPPETPAADATATAAPAAPAAPAGGETLPGASRVREALASKDYETAVGALLALRGAATGDRAQEYTMLYGEVVDTLRAESTTNRKAAEAYATLMASRSAR